MILWMRISRLCLAITIGLADTLRQHALISVDNAIVLATASDAHVLAIFDHDEEDCRCSHADKSRGDEAILIAQIPQPWGDAVQD